MNRETGSRDLSAVRAVSEKVCEGEADVGLILHLQAQLEEMFSESHLAEDGFLLKHIQKNKEGFVSLKLLTCLKKIKVLTDNWYMTLTAALLSPALQVNEESNKVRRLRDYPDWLLCSPTSKLLLFWNLPPDWTISLPSTHAEPQICLSRHFLSRLASFGPLMHHWLLIPGQDIPKELQCYSKRQKELGQDLCAVVKFDTLAAVRRAYGELKAEEMRSAGRGIRVVSLGYRSSHLINKEQPGEETSRGDAGTSQEQLPQSRARSSNAEPQEERGTDRDGGVIMESLDAGDSPTLPWVIRQRNKWIIPPVRNLVQVIRQPNLPDDTRGFRLRRNKTV